MVAGFQDTPRKSSHRIALSIKVLFPRFSQTAVRPASRLLHTSMRVLTDKVFIQELAVTAVTGRDAWSKPSPQPITVSVGLQTDFHQASVTDNLKYSLNYAVISRNILEYMKLQEHRNFGSLGKIAEDVAEVVLDPKKHGGEHAEVVVKSTKSEIRANSIEYAIVRQRDATALVDDHIKVNGLRLLTIIGVFTFEREQRQIVDIDIDMLVEPQNETSVHQVVDDVVRYVENSNFKTVEALVNKIGQLVFQSHGSGVRQVSVKVTKPNAITFTEGVGVVSDMTAVSFANVEPITFKEGALVLPFDLPTSSEEAASANTTHVAYIAFGSNEGDQLENINTALQLLEQHGVHVEATSLLYLSKPMYHKEQADFYNGVVKTTTRHSPHELLKVLKQVEYQHLQRVKEFDNGPRSIDLDIVLYDEISINTADLTIPHKSMLERTFVLQPLCEVLDPEYVHPVLAEPVHDHLKQLWQAQPGSDLQESAALLVVVPVGRSGRNLEFDMQQNTHRTLIMGILNTTPDSFSDGGQNYQLLDQEVQQKVLQLVEDGADIIDIGGVSTRPGSEAPSVEEEIQRVVPVVRAIRQSTNPKVAQVLLSIDTFRAQVAERSLKAGADIINDVSMGLQDSDIFDVVARFGCPYIASHTRGTFSNMNKHTIYESNTNEDIVEFSAVEGSQETANLVSSVGRELAAQITKAFAHGVRKWQIIADPGIGFAKTGRQNLALLSHTRSLRSYAVANRAAGTFFTFSSVPVLIGASRKRFLGALVDQPVAANRVFATGATVSAAIEQGTSMVRVHDVAHMHDVARVADAIYKKS